MYRGNVQWWNTLYINLLELSAVKKAISSLQRQCQAQTDPIEDRQLLKQCSTSIDRDKQNLQSCALLQKEAALLSPLECKASSSTHSWGKKNVIVDQLSRGRQILKMKELSLNRDIFQQIFRFFLHSEHTCISVCDQGKSETLSFVPRSQILSHGDGII